MTPAARIDLDGNDITANLIPAPFGLPLVGGGVAIIAGALRALSEITLGALGSGGALISLTVTDNENKKSDSVELVVDNREMQAAPTKGAKLEIWMGYSETGLTYMGQYQVDTWTKKGRPRTLTISAKAVGLDTEIKSPKSRSYHETTVGEIMDKVSGYNSLSAITHPDLQSIKIGHIDQSNESDLHFCTRLAERVGGNFKLANGQMIMNKAGSGQLPSGTDAPVFAISEVDGTVKDWSATGSERGSYGSAKATWTDTEKGERQTAEAGSGKPVYRLRGVFKTESEAQVAAQAALSRLNRGRVSLELSLWGNADIFAGARVDASDFDPDVDGLYQIKTSTHKIDSSGFESKVSTETANEEGGDDSELTGSGGGDDSGGDGGGDEGGDGGEE